MRNEPALPELRLSDAETKLIQRLKANERQWFRIRWWSIFISSLVFAGSIVMFQRIWSTVASDQILMMLCLFVAPVSGIVLFVSLTAFLYVLAFWNGRPINKLLLRLAEKVESNRT
jgi:hypothetical protein